MTLYCSYCNLAIEGDAEYLSIVRRGGECQTPREFAHPKCFVFDFILKQAESSTAWEKPEHEVRALSVA